MECYTLGLPFVRNLLSVWLPLAASNHVCLCSKRPKGQVGIFSGLLRHTFLGIPLFLGGDFNCIDSLELDKAGGDFLAGDKGSVELKDFVDSLSLCDVFRIKFPKSLPDITSSTLICRRLIKFMPQKYDS